MKQIVTYGGYGLATIIGLLGIGIMCVSGYDTLVYGVNGTSFLHERALVTLMGFITLSSGLMLAMVVDVVTDALE